MSEVAAAKMTTRCAPVFCAPAALPVAQFFVSLLLLVNGAALIRFWVGRATRARIR